MDAVADDALGSARGDSPRKMKLQILTIAAVDLAIEFTGKWERTGPAERWLNWFGQCKTGRTNHPGLIFRQWCRTKLTIARINEIGGTADPLQQGHNLQSGRDFP